MIKQPINNAIKEKYGKIALTGNLDCCCMPKECCNGKNNSLNETSIAIGYDSKELNQYQTNQSLE
jgi:arsenite methyltransferase